MAKLEAMLGEEEEARLIDAEEAVGAQETVRTVFVPPPDDKGLAQGLLYRFGKLKDWEFGVWDMRYILYMALLGGARGSFIPDAWIMGINT